MTSTVDSLARTHDLHDSTTVITIGEKQVITLPGTGTGDDTMTHKCAGKWETV